MKESLVAQVMWQVKKDTVIHWYYADGDEFNEYQVNLSKWRFAPDWGNAVIKQKLYFTNGDNVYQSNGYVHLILKNEKLHGHIYPWEIDTVWLRKHPIEIRNDSMWFNYTSGQLISKLKYKHGYFECRFKNNAEQGTWPAFWLFGAEPNNEIDWMELKGERKKQLHVDVHCPDSCEDYRGGFLNLEKNWGGWIKTTKPLSERFNIISGEWNENYLVFYFNGIPIAWFKHRYDLPMWLIIGNGVAMDHEAFHPGPSKKTCFPNEFVVDYVRVWTALDTARKNLPANFYNSEKTFVDDSKIKSNSIRRKLRFIYSTKILSNEMGTITLLPIDKNKFSLTFLGPQITPAIITMMNDKNVTVKIKEVKGPGLVILEFSELPVGKYYLKLECAGKVINHSIDIW